ncbi:prion-inhibition and propagation-domain-containing protein [Chaetomidium leptoderma]|uniref:Prion-inhibition and propagation-domain-containing protein n=1 Tax=Chaetomidium leptoderma TaxID=669021 RepID=A0AAN6ZZS2_9PEZI|nr:prion-inhibition and propagation-domain-containing protein [Chaetomidium leptoderma]
MHEDYQYIQVRLQVERQRFLNFSTEAGLLYEDRSLSAVLKVNRAVLLAVLAEVKGLLDKFASEHAKYETIAPMPPVDWLNADEPGSQLEELLWCPGITKPAVEVVQNWAGGKGSGSSVIKRHMVKVQLSLGATGRKLRRIVAEPRRLRWAAVDGPAWEAMVRNLTGLNDFLIALLQGSQIERIQENTTATYRELLELRNDVRSLQGLIQALSPSTSGGQELHHAATQDGMGEERADILETISLGNEKDQKRRAYLTRLAELKILHTEIRQMTARHRDFAHKIKVVKERESLSAESLGLGHEILAAGVDGRRMQASTPAIEDVEARVCLLTDLLAREMPGEFRAPAVLGYTRIDVPTPAFGLVSGNPSGSEQATRLSTLKDFLGLAPLPSLSRRLRLCAVLANAISNFHSVQWLHKGVRSDSVLFFRDENEQVDIASPHLSGFDLSRPDAMDLMSQRPGRCPPRDMYRHADVQSGRGGVRYRKCYDWYGFGIVLTEIALWEHIERVLELGKPEEVSDLDLHGIRSRILGEVEDSQDTKPGDDGNQQRKGVSILERVAAQAGDAYSEIVELCVRADEIQASNGDGMSEESLSFRLDVVMSKSAVGKLQALALAL